eukprot:Gb_39782 [translate_table: standard]
MTNSYGIKVRKFKDLAELGVLHFKRIFEESVGANIVEIPKVLSYFPRMENEEDNARVFREVSKEELFHILSTFRKDRSLGPDGWTANFFLDFFDLLSDDLLRVVEEVRMLGRVPANISATFISMIPKVDYLDFFEGFRPISLCNSLYKIISKVLVVKLKSLLSNVISAEHIGFFDGRRLTWGGRLILIKSILEAILVYWHTLAHIPKGTLEKIRKLRAEDLGLAGDWVVAWNNYTASLIKAHIKLFDEVDELI